MIAVDLSGKRFARIAFHSDLSTVERYSALKNLFYYSDLLLGAMVYPEFRYDWEGKLIEIPNIIYLPKELNYYAQMEKM